MGHLDAVHLVGAGDEVAEGDAGLAGGEDIGEVLVDALLSDVVDDAYCALEVLEPLLDVDVDLPGADGGLHDELFRGLFRYRFHYVSDFCRL